MLRVPLVFLGNSLVLSVLWTALVAGTATAQVYPAFQSMRQSESGRLLEPPRAMLQAIQGAEQAIQSRSYGEAVMVLGEFLRREAIASGSATTRSQDYFLSSGSAAEMATRAVATAAGEPQTLVAKVRQILSQMPREGLETYELQYGAQARQQLEQAAATRDWAAVALVRRSYFHTAAGRDATALLAQQAVTLGQSVEAERLLQALRQHWSLSAEQAISLEILLHTVQQTNGTAVLQPKPQRQPTAFDEPADLVPVVRPSVEFPFDGQRVTIADYRAPGTPPLTTLDQDPLDRWLKQNFASLRPRDQQRGGRTDVLSGLAEARDAVALQGQLPLSLPRWEFPSTTRAMEPRVLRESQESMVSAGQAMPPSAVPLKIGNQILMRGSDRLYAIDNVTGKLIWQHPWFDSVPPPALPPEWQAMELDENSEQILLRQRVWNDAPYGRITSDGQRVFLLDRLPPLEVLAYNALMGIQRGAATVVPTNTLVALDLASEGKLLWQIGGAANGPDDWSEAFFLGAPLPLGGSLYAIVEIASEIHLVCLDAQTGRQQWRQQLLAVESSRLTLDPIRRIAGATPSFSQGLLVCPTGAGMVVAVDLADRSLAWATPVQRDEALSSAAGRREMLNYEQYSHRWWDGTAHIVGRTVYVTPVESNRFYAIDLLTGQPRFSSLPRLYSGDAGSTGAYRYLAGVWEQTVVLVGNDTVHGIDAASGTTRWVTSDLLDSGEVVAGLGVFGSVAVDDQPAAPVYLVPTNKQRLLAVSLADGRLLDSRDLQYPAGNLLAVDGQIVSQSPTGLAVAYGQRSLGPVVEAALESNPDDFQALVHHAELALQTGELQQSLDWLQRAKAVSPQEPRVEDLSVKVMLRLLQSDFAANQHLLPSLETMIFWRADRLQLLCLQVHSLLQQGQPAEAFERLQRLSAIIIDDPAVGTSERTEGDDQRRQISLDAWVAARGYQAWTQANEQQRQTITSLLAPPGESVHLDRNASREHWFRHFGDIPGSEAIGESLARSPSADNRSLKSERMVMRMVGSTNLATSQLNDWQIRHMQWVYTQDGMYADAAVVAAMAADPKPVEMPEHRRDGTERALRVQHLQDASRLPAWGPYFAAQLMPEYSRVRASSTRGASGRIRSILGATFQGWQVVSEPASPFGLRDPLGTVYPIPLDSLFARRDDPVRQVVISGGIAIVLLPNEMVGIDLFEMISGRVNSILWRRPWRSGGGGVGLRSRSQVTRFGDQTSRFMLSGLGEGGRIREVVLGPIGSDEFYLLQGHELIAYDLLTAQPRWRTTDTPSSGAILKRGEQLAVVSPLTNEIALFDRRDGRRISTQPLGDYQLWAATDDTLLLYRDGEQGSRSLQLRDPFSDKTLLSHEFTNLSPAQQVFGRIVQSRYSVTLTSQGQLLVWDLVQAKQVTLLDLPPIADLDGLQVLLRADSLLVMPTILPPTVDRTGAASQISSGQDHVRVDHSVSKISLTDGQLAWTHSLNGDRWGCTLSQASASPLLILARGNTLHQTTNSSTRTLDIQAIDLRDGQAKQLLNLPVESIGHEIETTLLVQPSEQLLAVAVGNSLRLEYRFSETPVEDVPLLPSSGEEPDNEEPSISERLEDLFSPLDPASLDSMEPLGDISIEER